MKSIFVNPRAKNTSCVLKALFFLLLFAEFKISAQDQFNFIVSEPGSAPYIYTINGKYVGIIPEILQGLVEAKDIKIKYLSNSRSRSEEYLYQGSADMMFLSESWLKRPDKVIATIPILQHRTFLYKIKKFNANFSITNLKDKKNLCTIKGYKYPSLEVHFSTDKLIRIDSTNHKTMFRMLLKNRCDMVISNELNAKTLFNSTEFKRETFFRSNEPTSVVPINIILRPTLSNLQALINSHIKQLQKSGKLEQIIMSNVYTDL